MAPTLVTSCLIGMSRPGLAAAWTVASFVLPLVGMATLPWVPPANLLIGQGGFGVLAIICICCLPGNSFDRGEIMRLVKFAPVGIAIGVLSPIAMLRARTWIADVAGWDLVAESQCIWRVNEWVQASASGLLSSVWLPKLTVVNVQP